MLESCGPTFILQEVSGKVSKSGLRLRGLIAIAALIIVALYCIVSEQLRLKRQQAVAATVRELKRGNYFAWVQLRHWDEQNTLTVAEREILVEACTAFARTNSVLKPTTQNWIVDGKVNTAFLSKMFCNIQDALALHQRSLLFQQTFVWPAFSNVPVS